MQNKHTILVVDDDNFIRAALTDLLKQAGFDVLTSEDGESGLNIALSKKPDLILLDLIMPQVDGISMLNMLREDPWGQTAPVIILTNVDEPQTILESLHQGVKQYLVKANIKSSELLKIINQTLRK